MTERNKENFKFVWRITAAHTVAYFIAGVFSITFFNYAELWASEALSSFYRPLDDPFIALGTAFQLLRGIIIALILLPLRKPFFEEKNGLLKLCLVIIGFSLISTIGAPWGSFESYIYTQIPLGHQLMAYPESILYTALFIGILFIFKKFGHKKIVTILSVISTILVCLMSVVGYMTLIGKI